MGAVRGIFAGSLTLVAMETVLSSDGATKRFGQLLGIPTVVAQHVLDPAYPLFGKPVAPAPKSGSSNGASAYIDHLNGTGVAQLAPSQFTAPVVPGPTPSPTPNPAPRIAPTR